MNVRVNRGAGRPRTACTQCSSLKSLLTESAKIRCSGEQPSCRRCTRLGRHCTWADDYRAQRAFGHNHLDFFARDLDAWAMIPSLPADSHQSSAVGISRTCMFDLVNTFFTHVFNASLLLHRTSFLDCLSCGSAEKHMTLSVMALASRFSQKPNPCDNAVGSGFAEELATEAERLVFARLASPSEENLVTLVNLTLLWYAQGQWRRAAIHLSNAQCTSRILGLGRKPLLGYSNNQEQTVGDFITAELSRRRFWAVFLLSQFAKGDDCYQQFEAELKDPAGVKAPCNEQMFQPLGNTNLDRHFGNQIVVDSLYAHMIRVTSMWTMVLTCSSRRTVCQLVKSHSKFTAKLLTIQELDLRFNAWRTSLPSSLELDDVLQDSSLRRSKVSLLHIIYHQVMSVLHACVIPLFCLHSIRPTDATDTPSAATEADREMETETDPMAYESLQRASAQKALYHARQISHIISKTELNGVQLLSSGFTGYAAYSSCAIQLPFLWCRSPNVREMARRNIQANIAVMDYIQSQWKVVAALRGYIPLLYKHHESMSYSLPDEPVNLQLADLNLHCKSDSNRATMSILHHNAIIWDKGELLNHDNLPDIGLATRRQPQQQQQSDKVGDGGYLYNNSSSGISNSEISGLEAIDGFPLGSMHQNDDLLDEPSLTYSGLSFSDASSNAYNWLDDADFLSLGVLDELEIERRVY
ncbi:hypothetical protein M441DRAFT_94006 [Trichoderma asperellum CBS 433.97]|uniref:Zn(2)-C6 fungal-type domain-containing protein n=1 Tax=Trichoderma asperellum (strain ATCC 204424 / CBS 433.97 / NBRC 101777) TaxID=1042311 RepID=A0A2T3YRH6_TRIA4|nr:hypothetical protein M441DRAFT_94006 [Trichoderma asperellum CBS 433.97]PTB35162.1 hypothetical protein M441DRAFT_94006 [Trichoderma asperellum CBS 433.97]